MPCVGWRWKDRNDQLGETLAAARQALLTGSPLDLRAPGIRWIEATGDNQRKALWEMVSAAGSVVVLARFDSQCENLARSLGGRFDVMEDIEGKRLLAVAASLDADEGPRAAGAVLALVMASMIKLPPTLTNKVKVLQQGRFPDFRPGTSASSILQCLQVLSGQPTAEALRHAIEAVDQLGASVIRHEAWSDFRRAALAWEQGAPSLVDAVRNVRDRGRAAGRRTRHRAFSRVVLVKGLEYDHCVVTTPQDMTMKELYVALTRGTLSLTVISPEPVLQPR